MSGNFIKLVLGVVGVLLLGAISLSTFHQAVRAETAESSSYQADSLQIGGISEEACSDEYCAEATFGEVFIGDSGNDLMDAQFYDEVSEDPKLEVIVAGGAAQLGTLSTQKTASKQMLVRVRTHGMRGYQIQIVGDVPSAGTNKLNTKDRPTAARPGQELFGINAVKNQNPAVGRDPVRRDAATEPGDIEILPRYRTADQFYYHSGDPVVRSQVGSGRVDYVISLVMNISEETPPGRYGSLFMALVTPLY